MSLTKILGLVLAFTLMGCQPAPNQTSTISHTGRNSYNGNASAASGKAWGIITNSQGDQSFWQELSKLTAPVLSGLNSNEQLGFVSAQQGQTTGVTFYGNVAGNPTSSTSQNFNPSGMMLHIEIIDSNAGTTNSDGSVVPDLPLEFSSAQSTFQGATGNISQGRVFLQFQDSVLGTVYLSGTVNGQYFSGSIGFSNGSTSGAETLGQFTVPTCGFFTCQ